MSRIEMYYFSGTGNTKWVSLKLVELLKEKGIQAGATSIEKASAGDIKPYTIDQIGILFPIHTSIAPKPMSEFMSSLPDGNNTHLFAVSSAWLFGGHTPADYCKPMKKKGYNPYLFATVFMPNNINLPPFGWIPIRNGKHIEGKLKKAERKIVKLAERIANVDYYEEGNTWFSKWSDRSQRKADHTTMVDFYADENCIGCGLCARDCPVRNIDMVDGIPSFGGDCIVCMRCYSFCPREAIQSKHGKKDSAGYTRYKGPFIKNSN